MHSPARTLLILLFLAVGGVSALAFVAYRYAQVIETDSSVPAEAVRRVESFIRVRTAMRREIDSWGGSGPRQRELTLVRDRALALHRVDRESYVEIRGLYRNWLAGRLRAGSTMAAMFEGRRSALGRVDLGAYELLDS
jgi:hypothetical protein